MQTLCPSPLFPLAKSRQILFLVPKDALCSETFPKMIFQFFCLIKFSFKVSETQEIFRQKVFTKNSVLSKEKRMNFFLLITVQK